MSRIRKIIKYFIPDRVLEQYRIFRHKKILPIYWNLYQIRYKRILVQKRRKNTPYIVVFVVVDKSIWKYDSVYKLMKNDSLFEPYILVCPTYCNGAKFLSTLNECYNHFQSLGYNVINSYRPDTESFIDINELKPDIVFFSNPYKEQVCEQHYITHVRNALTCYVNYGYINTKYKWCVSLPFHNMVWRFFVENHDNYNHVKSLSAVSAKNCVITGYPIFEDLNTLSNPWKKQDNKLKIIWAPHHSIFDIKPSDSSVLVRFSTFLLYSDAMLELARKYSKYVQIAFKPHPYLKNNLYNHPEWGKEKTDQYYEIWNNLPNGFVVEGDYTDLFFTSDALIHDCGSFTIEYLYTQKPVMFLANYDRASQANITGKKAYDSHYIAMSKDDIESFILDVVLGGNDPLKEKREMFYKNYLLPPYGNSASSNIVEHIKAELGKNDLKRKNDICK